jgi:hypothetical protein
VGVTVGVEVMVAVLVTVGVLVVVKVDVGVQGNITNWMAAVCQFNAAEV